MKNVAKLYQNRLFNIYIEYPNTTEGRRWLDKEVWHDPAAILIWIGRLHVVLDGTLVLRCLRGRSQTGKQDDVTTEKSF